MPLYDFKCSEGHKFERIVPLAEFKFIQICSCGMASVRMISRPMFSVDNTDYSCPVTGERISSKHQHENNLAKQNCRVLEPGETAAAAKFREAEELRFDKSIEDTVEREVTQMSSDKREKLYSELTRGGADVEYSRSAV